MSAAVLLKLLKKNNIKSSTEVQSSAIIVNHQQKTELSRHRPRSEAHRNEYENNTHKAEESLPAWRRAGRSRKGTKPLLSSSDLSYSLAVSAAVMLKFLKKDKI